jgi:hypothetical protein
LPTGGPSPGITTNQLQDFKSGGDYMTGQAQAQAQSLPQSGGYDGSGINPNAPGLAEFGGGQTGEWQGGSGNYPVPQENPYPIETDPGYQFRFNEGMRGLEGSAAARGGLLSGGFGRKAIRYGQDFASNEYTNIYNRVSNIAGLGQVSAQSTGNQGIAAGQAMGRAAGDAGLSSAYGQQGAANAWANTANEIGQLPWDQVFNGGGGGGGGGGGKGYRHPGGR